MEFLGVGPWELLFVLIIALVVVGPERLPVLARQAGKALVTVRNWVQKSPDAAMVMRARQEIEAELANLRESLAEVQSARDEVVQAARQVNTMVKDDVIGSTRTAIDEITQPGTVARSTKPNGLPANPAPSAAAQTDMPPVDEPALVATDGSTLIEHAVEETQTILPPPTDTSSAASTPDVVVLQAQIAALTAELRGLQTQLQERGVIDPAPLVELHATVPAPVLVEPELSAGGSARIPTTLEEHADVEQPVYSRD